MVKFHKLPKGRWGIRAWRVPLKAGEKVEVTKRDGSTATVTVDKIVKRDGQATIATIKIAPRKPTTDREEPYRTDTYPDREYERGRSDTRAAQMMGPAGSPGREAAYLAMEQQWDREGFDG